MATNKMFVFKAEENTQMYLSKALCNKNHMWLKGKAIIRRSPLFYKHIFAILVGQVHEILLKIVNRKISYITESGLVNMALKNFRNNPFGFVKNTHPDFQLCMVTNEISNLQGYAKIRLENVWKFLTIFFVYDCSLVLFFAVFRIKLWFMWKTRGRRIGEID